MPPTAQTLQQAVALHNAGRHREAEALYRQILAAEPNHPEALHLLGVLAHQHGHHDDALQLIARACEVAPAVPQFRLSRGQILWQLRQIEGALECYRSVLQLDPDHAQALAMVGGHEVYRFELDAGERHLTRALERDPTLATTYSSLGLLRHRQNRLAEAIPFYRTAVYRSPQEPATHFDLSVALLLDGQYEEGWAEHEWRLLLPNYRNYREQSIGRYWNGCELSGKSIRIGIEGGFGDTIQFARYAALLAERGARVTLITPPELHRLFAGTLASAPSIVPPDHGELGDFEVLPFSLPHLLRTTVATIPAPQSYLSAEPADAARWKERVKAEKGKLKVGLVWTGKPGEQHADYNRQRSISPADLAPLALLAEAANVSFFALVKNSAAAKLATDWPIVQLGDELHDFADTAAVLANLDLLISVDTAIVHLAGAMGVPVWNLLAFAPDWRWMLRRDDSPWYPSMRLFRQLAPGDWGSVVRNVAETLSALARTAVR